MSKKTSKSSKSREKILAPLVSQKCISAYDGIPHEGASSGYGLLSTAEIIVKLWHYGQYQVIGCGQQMVRKNEKKYQTDAGYKKQIEKKQRMAKHWVLLWNAGPYRILIINGHKGNIATKLYFGDIKEGADIYGIEFRELLHFVSIRHTHDNAAGLDGIIKDFLQSTLRNSTKQKEELENLTITEKAFTEHLKKIAFLPKKAVIEPDTFVQLYEKKEYKQNNLYYLLQFATEIMVNHFTRHQTKATIGYLLKQANLALLIRIFVVQALERAKPNIAGRKLVVKNS